MLPVCSRQPRTRGPGFPRGFFQDTSRPNEALLAILGAVLLLFPPSAVCLDQDQASLVERFLREAPPKWEQYLDFAKKLQGTTLGQEERGEGGEWKPTSREVVKRNERCSLKEWHLLSSGKRWVWGSNPQYSFQLRHQNNGWVLENYDLDKELRVGAGTVSQDVRDVPLSPFNSLGRPLSALLQEPNFKVTRAEKQVIDGHEFVRIHFESPCPLTQQAYHDIQAGVLLLDPEHCWCIKELEIWRKMKSGVNDSMKSLYEYKEGSGKFPILTRRKLTAFSDKNVAVATVEVRYDLEEVRNPPGDEEFRLTAYGLPEPRGVVWPKKASKWWLWFIGMGLASLILGAYAWHRHKRRTAREVQAAAIPTAGSSP
jgi:hypothetical protein